MSGIVSKPKPAKFEGHKDREHSSLLFEEACVFWKGTKIASTARSYEKEHVFWKGTKIASTARSYEKEHVFWKRHK